MSRTPVDKTLKMLVGGSFVRSESGRTLAAGGRLRAPAASKKDVRDAIEAAAKAQPGWAGATAYLRGQVVYRLAEMLESRRSAFEPDAADGELDRSADLLVSLAGWSDKVGQVLGSSNQVAGPYHNFTIPVPVGVVGVICPDVPALEGLIGTVIPAVVSGCSVVALVSRQQPWAVAFGEVIATSDVPAGVINLLTGDVGELAPHFASHRGLSALVACGVDGPTRRVLELGAAENLKRVSVFEVPASFAGLAEVERTLEFKTLWHPSSA
jgi:acyl-CoA reductase-like NAD-dependent aldehyde dehydrogenase